MAALKARKTVLFIIAILELSIIFAQYVTNVWAAVAFISLAVASHQAWATNIFTAASDMFPETSCELRGRNWWHGRGDRRHFLSCFCGLFVRLL